MMPVTLMYTVGLFRRREVRRILASKGFDYTEGRGFIDRAFYVTADIAEHVKLAKEFYRA